MKNAVLVPVWYLTFDQHFPHHKKQYSSRIPQSNQPIATMGRKGKKSKKSKQPTTQSGNVSAAAAASATPSPAPTTGPSPTSVDSRRMFSFAPNNSSTDPPPTGFAATAPANFPGFGAGSAPSQNSNNFTLDDLSPFRGSPRPAATSSDDGPNDGNNNDGAAAATTAPTKTKTTTDVDESNEAPKVNYDDLSLPTLLDGSTSNDEEFSEDDDDDTLSGEVKSPPGSPTEADGQSSGTPVVPSVIDMAEAKKLASGPKGKVIVEFGTDFASSADGSQPTTPDAATSPASMKKDATSPNKADDAKEEENSSGSEADSEDDSEDDSEEEEEIDDASHPSMPSLVDGAISDPDLDGDVSDTWAKVSGENKEEGGAENSNTNATPTMAGASGPFSPAFTFGSGSGTNAAASSLMDLDSIMKGRLSGASNINQVTDDDGENAANNGGGASPPSSSGKKKKKKSKKKSKKKGKAAPACPITEAVKNGVSGPDIETKLREDNLDVSTFRSKTSGHTLLQVAAMAGQIDLLDYLVKDADADPTYTGSNGRTLENFASTTPSKKKVVSLTNWYNVKKAREAEELRRLQNSSATRIQAIARMANARSQLDRARTSKEANLGPWSKLLDKLLSLEVETSLNLGHDKLPEGFGKSWIQLKKELDLVVQDEEPDILGNAALQLSTNANDGEADESVAPVVSPPANSSDNIQLTADVLRWVRKQGPRQRALFVDRLVKFMAGDWTNCRSELMKGSKTKYVTAIKLNEKETIITSQRGNDVLVWFVCRKENISRCRQMVDLSYERIAEADGSVQIDTKEDSADGVAPSPAKVEPTVDQEPSDDGVSEKEEPEMLVDPNSNVPLKIHEVQKADLDLFKDNPNYIPTLKLTEEEESIVRDDKGTVLLLGRSGTGKTLCVCNRMLRDSQYLYDAATTGQPANQLFVARTNRLCSYVKGIFEGAGGDSKRVKFQSLSNFAQELYGENDPRATAPVVDFRSYCSEIWAEIKGREKELDELMVWTQIRSFIKGSWDAAINGPLSKDSYLALPRERCRLAQNKREDAYAIFMRYQIFLEEKGWMDSMDKTSSLIKKMMAAEDVKLYDRIYVDEVQDITQAEIGLLFLAAGKQYDGLFLAGDPAQAVSQGVDFRFEEVRSLVYTMSGGQSRVERWQKLHRNFRSHEGILRVSNLVLDCLHGAFPGAALKLPTDTGVTVGPRPGVLESSFEELARLVKANEKLRILTRDDQKSALCAKLQAYAPGAKNNVWGIVEAKGLEFSDCVVVNFFSTADPGLQKSYKTLFLDPQAIVSNKKGRGSSIFPPSMELELKLFYTGITRACNRLLVIETQPSQAFDAFSRALKTKTLVDVMTPDAVIKEGQQIMTADDWRKEAFEMASLAEANEIDATNFLERAIAAMEKAGDAALVEKAQYHLTALKYEAEATAALMNAGEHDDAAVNSILSYLEAGLVDDAERACGVLAQKSCVKGLARRIKKLGEYA